VSKGIDYAFSPHPSASALKSAGVTFVCRYISAETANDANGKNLLPAEKAALLAAGFQLVVVVEEGATRMLGGRAAGVADAAHADSVAKALGLAGMPVYFACDFDSTEAQQAAINAYLDGCASVIGVGRVGIYGGYYPVKRALDAGKAKYAWQTYAWSGGLWDARAQLRQVQNGVTVGGASCDVDQSQAADFGQWPRPKPLAPKPVAVPPKPAPPKTWHAWTTAGAYSLADFAANVAHCDVATLLTQTVKHYGALDKITMTYVNGLASGKVKPTDKIIGARFWVYA
jgi:hypothetical protein